MKLFIDSANLEEVREAVSWGVIDGVTTNPTLVAKEGLSFEALIADICKIVKGPVSAEVIATRAGEMVAEAKKLAAIDEQVVIKVPMTSEGLAAAAELKKEEIKTNVTLVFSLNQALLAARAGAAYISPFVGRLDDHGYNGVSLVADICQIINDYGLESQVIAASVRHPLHVADAALAGAHIATVPFAVLKKMFLHPMTDLGIESFLADWEKAGKSSR